jgi:hypothetical protein
MCNDLEFARIREVIYGEPIPKKPMDPPDNKKARWLSMKCTEQEANINHNTLLGHPEFQHIDFKLKQVKRMTNQMNIPNPRPKNRPPPALPADLQAIMDVIIPRPKTPAPPPPPPPK